MTDLEAYEQQHDDALLYADDRMVDSMEYPTEVPAKENPVKDKEFTLRKVDWNAHLRYYTWINRILKEPFERLEKSRELYMSCQRH